MTPPQLRPVTHHKTLERFLAFVLIAVLLASGFPVSRSQAASSPTNAQPSNSGSSSITSPGARTPAGPWLAPGTQAGNALAQPIQASLEPGEREEFALHPSVWMAGTEGWASQRLGNVVFRTPAGWSQDASASDALRLNHAGHSITVTRANNAASTSATPPAALAAYVQSGAALRAGSFKGLSAWLVTNLPTGADTCQIVAVQVATDLVVFELQAPKTFHGCEDSVVFDLITSSLQISIDAPAASTPSPLAPQSSPFIAAPAATLAAVDYDRAAAKAYADTWGPQRTNADGEFVECTPFIPRGCDGAHFIAHALEAGGVAWPVRADTNPSTNDAVIVSIDTQRTYLLTTVGQPTIYQTVAEALKIGDIIYIGGEPDWCWGGVVVDVVGNIPFVATHSDINARVQYNGLSCGPNQGYDFIHINATSDAQRDPPPPRTAQVKGRAATSAIAGDPVNTSTGNYHFDFTDLTDPTPGLPLNATRWYNALDAASVSGPFGFGTAWVFGMTVSWRADKTAVVQMDDGSLAYFVGELDPANPNDLTGPYIGQNEVVGTLVRAADGAGSLTLPDQTAFAFNTLGQLVRISHPYPATIELVYTGGALSQLVHSAGVTYSISYSGQYIAGITSSGGRSVSYSYTPAGDLSRVTLPDGATYSYSYDANHRMTEARDPNNTPYVSNSYDEQGRVVEQLDQAGQRSTFAYGASVTDAATFTDSLGNPAAQTHDGLYRLSEERDALGRTTIYLRDGRGNVTQMTDHSGQIWRYGYDERSNLLSETDPLGNTTLSTYDARNNRIAVRDPLGNTTTYIYDGADRLTQVVDPLGNTRSYTYDAQGNLAREQDEVGAQTAYGYNSLGLRTTITDALGNVTRIEYDSLSNITRYTDAAGRVATSTYDAQSRLTRSIDPIGTVVDFTYDPIGNLLSQTDGLGNLRSYRYDSYDRLVEERDFRGNPTRYGYDSLGRRTSVTDAIGFTTTFTYNQVGELIARQAKDGTVTVFGYDPNGRLLYETDPLGRVTSYVYDVAGRQTELRRACDACPGGVAISRTVYDTAGRVVEEIDPRGAVTRFTHDALGRVATRTMPNSGVYRYTYDPTGRLIQEIDPLGGVTLYGYDRLGRVLTITDALGRVTTSVYDPVGNVVEMSDPRGNKTTFTFDANDRQVRRTDALGDVAQMAYDAQGRMIAETDALGQITRMTYDPNGNQTSVTDRTGAITRSEYDALNRLVKRIDALNGEFFTTYDAMGRVAGTTDALGGTTATTYDASGRRIAERDLLGFTRTFSYDRADNLVEQREPTGAVTRYAYDAGGLQVGMTNALNFTQVYTYDIAGNLTAEQNERGFVTRYEYDLLNRRTAQIDPLSARQVTTYDAAGQVVSAVDFNGNTTRYEYDAAGNQVKQTDALGGVMSTAYDALNRAVAVTDPLGRVSRTVYDVLGRVVRTTSPAGNVTSYGFDAEGRQTEVTDPLGQTSRTVYDALGRPVKLIDALGRETLSAYDALGRLTANTDALGRVTRYGLDAAGRLLSVTAPGEVTQRYTYDSVGNVLSEQDGRGAAVRYTYDLMNRMAAMIYGADSLYLPLVARGGTGSAQPPAAPGPISSVGRRVWAYGYDGAGNQISVSTPAGRRITMAYDALDRLTEKRHDGALFASYSYDANGNRVGMRDARGATSYTYDALNRLVASADPAGRTASNSFDAVGQRTRLTYPDGAAASYAYNLDGALSQITALDGGVTRYTLDGLNRPTRIAQANGVVIEQRYDTVGNLLELTERGPGGALIARHRYTHDQVNRRVRQIADLPQGSVTTDYSYDALDRLVQSSGSDGSAARYSFDAAGNRLSEEGVRLSAGVAPEAYQTTFRYSRANELLSVTDSVVGTTSYSYNADGQRTSYEGRGERARYSYDAEGRLVEAQVEDFAGTQWLLRDDMFQRYAYDGDGRRVRMDSLLDAGANLSVRQEYRYDDFTGWDVLQSYDSVDSPSGVRYLYDQPLHKLAYGSGPMSYFVNDGLGSVVGATNSSGALSTDAGLMRYGDYGRQEGRVAALPTADGYTGYELDDYTGLSYARNRYYEARTGTFITPDPWPADRQDVLGLHRYLYTQADPLNNTDPLGLFNWATNTVERGDTLWGIANAIDVTVDQLLQLNPQINDRNLIYPGQRLNLPAGISAKQQQQSAQQQALNKGTSTTNCGKKASCGGTHIVQPGEYLSLIGAKYGVSWQSIYNANRAIIGNNPNQILPGQRFTIPCGSSGAQPIIIIIIIITPSKPAQPATPAITDATDKFLQSIRTVQWSFTVSFARDANQNAAEALKRFNNRRLINPQRVGDYTEYLGSKLAAYGVFSERVAEERPWDIKRQEPYSDGNPVRICARKLSFDTPGNFLYAYAGRACAFSEDELSSASALVQLLVAAKNYGIKGQNERFINSLKNEVRDQSVLKVGYDLWNRFGMGYIARNSFCDFVNGSRGQGLE